MLLKIFEVRAALEAMTARGVGQRLADTDKVKGLPGDPRPMAGPGKSTFVALLRYDTRGGQILIDGLDIRKMTQETLHAQVSLIPQDPSLSHRSLRANILHERIDASDARP